MRIIQKQISLEPLTSRLPSIWPSFYNNDENVYYFDEESLKEREWLYTCNWGMVPLNIIVNPCPSSVTSDDETKPLNDRKNDASAYTTVSGCHCYNSYQYETNSGCSNCGNLSYDSLCCEPNECDGSCDEFILSFENLSKWYYFFNEYYNLLKKYGHCKRVYTSAEDYYNYESLTKYADQMKYGTDKQTYLGLDKKFYDYGGKVEVLVYDKDEAKYKTMTPQEAHDEFIDDRLAMSDVYDIGFFKWICENVVPMFTIPMEYKDYWKRDVLFYPDVVKWMKWFEGRLDTYDEDGANIADFRMENGLTELWDCKESAVTDCCECEEYFGRGGKRIYDKMKEWYDEVQDKIISNKEIITASTNCFNPTIIIPTNLQNSIDDLGQFSIFSEEYELGRDYRVAHYGDNANTHSYGTVASIDNTPMILTNGSGYTFNEEYMEKYVSKCTDCNYEGIFSEICPKCGSKNITQCGWEEYTDVYINHEYECNDYGCEDKRTFNYKNDFYVSALTYYAFDEYDVKHIATSSDKETAMNEIAESMAKKYPIITNEYGWILIDGILYEIKKTEFAKYNKNNEYLKDNTYLIFRENTTNTPYTFINGKKIFADFYSPKNVFYFPFFIKEDAEIKEKCNIKQFNIENYVQFKRYEKTNTAFYIEYNGNVYNLGENVIQPSYEINGNTYYHTEGYALTEDGETLYCIGNNIKFYDSTLMPNQLDDYYKYGYDKPTYAYMCTNCEHTEDNTFEQCPICSCKNIIKIIKMMPQKDEETNQYTFVSYNLDEITGSTVSKLTDIRLLNTLNDDIGNNIEGIYDVRTNKSVNHQPPQGTELELIYQVGNTANITRFRRTKENMNDIISESSSEDNWRNYFVGDIITNMTFYYEDYEDEVVEETIYHCELDNIDDKRKIYDYEGNLKYETLNGYTSLKAIQLATKKKNELEENGKAMKDNIYCDVTYYVGATLSRKYNLPYNLASVNRNDTCSNYGVRYTETVQFVKTNWEYYLKKPKNNKSILPIDRNDACKHSVSYPVYVYVLTQNQYKVYDSQYDSEYYVPMANFKFDINVFSGNGDTFSQKYPNEMAKHNNMQVYPTFREEYKLGTASIEKVDSNIYISRGINAAFEKHLKLGEVTSLEALLQYGNSYFKIINN